jgi:hypothetical protein
MLSETAPAPGCTADFPRKYRLWSQMRKCREPSLPRKPGCTAAAGPG